MAATAVFAAALCLTSQAFAYSVAATITVGLHPRSVMVHPGTGKVYVANFDSESVSVLSPGSPSPIASIFVGDRPVRLAYALPDARRAMYPTAPFVYVTHPYLGCVSIIRGDTDLSLGLSSSPGGSLYCDAFVDQVTGRLYVGDSAVSALNTFDTLNLSWLAPTALEPAGFPPGAIALNEPERTVYFTSALAGEPAVGEFSLALAQVLWTKSLSFNPGDLAFDAGMGRLYATDPAAGCVRELNPHGLDPTATPIPVGISPQGIAIDQDSHVAYVANTNSNSVTVFSTIDNSVIATVPVGANPWGLDVHPTTGAAYVANFGSSKVSVIASNSPPIAANDSTRTTENTPVTVPVLSNDSDPDSDEVTVTAVGAPLHGTAEIIPDGTVRYSPTADFSGADQFGYTVSDGHGGSDDATVTIVVNPSNDNIADATRISGTFGMITGNTSGATQERGEMAYNRSGAESIWYIWTAPASATYLFDTFGCSVDTILAVFTGGPSWPTLVQAAFDDDTYSPLYLQDKTMFAATAGVTYYIRVDTKPAGTGAGPITLTWNGLVPPANDDFANAQTISGTSGSLIGTTKVATLEANEPRHGGNYYTSYANLGSVWYSWTPAANGTVDFSVKSTPAGPADIYMGIITSSAYAGGSVASLTLAGQPAFTDYNNEARCSYTFEVSAGRTYHIAVDAMEFQRQGRFELEWLQTTRENNAPYAYDDYDWTLEDTPKVIDVLFNDYDSDTNDIAVTAVDDPAHGTATIAGDGRSITYSPDSGWIGSFSESDQFGYTITDSLGATASATVYVRVDVGPPDNDDWAEAAPLAGVAGWVDGTNAGATYEPGEPSDYCGSVWYVWTAPTTGDYEFDTWDSPQSMDTCFFVFDGTSLDWHDAVAGGDLGGNRESSVLSAVAGTTYHILVDTSTSSGSGSFTLTWRALAPPPNDDFADAEVIEGTSGLVRGTTELATRELGEPGHGTRSADSCAGSVWYSWTPSQSGPVSFSVTSTPDLYDLPVAYINDSLMSVYTGGAVGALTQVAANDDADSQIYTVRSALSFDAAAGVTYHIVVDEWGISDMGRFRLAWSQTPVVPPDKTTITASATASDKVYDATRTADVVLSLAGVLPGDDVTVTVDAANFADKNVGPGKLVTVTGLSLAGEDASSYELASTTATTTADITQRPVTVRYYQPYMMKPYDGTAFMSTFATADGFLEEDDYRIYVTDTIAETRTVGTSIPCSATITEEAGTDADNYYLTSWTVSGTCTIEPRPIEFQAVHDSKPYDGTASSDGTPVVLDPGYVDSLGLAPGEHAVLAQEFDSPGIGQDKAITVVQPVIILDAQGVNTASNYDIRCWGTITGTINWRTLTLSATAADKIYDATRTADVALSLAGVVGSEDVTVTATSASFSDKNVGADKLVTVSGLELSGADAGSYELASTTATTTADITLRPATFGFDRSLMQNPYDGTSQFTAHLDDGGKLPGDDMYAVVSVAIAETRTVGTNIPCAAYIRFLDGTDANNYELTSPDVEGTCTIVARPIDIVAVPDTKAYDGTTISDETPEIAPPNPPLSMGLASGETVVPIQEFDTPDVGGSKTLSVVPVTIRDAEGVATTGNYAVTYWTATGGITAGTVTASATASDKVYDATCTADVVLSLAGVLPGDDVTVTCSAANFADKNVGADKLVTVSGLSLAGADAGSYELASTTATTTADITTADLYVTAEDRRKLVGTELVSDGTEFSVAGLVGTDEVTSATFTSTGAAADAPEGTYPISSVGVLGTGLDNYVIHHVAGTLTVYSEATGSWTTDVGSDVSADFSANGSPAGSITFKTVTGSGTTSVTALSPGDEGYAPAAGFFLGEPPVYYAISTTASYSGTITVGLRYDPSAFPPAEEPRMYHRQDGVWTDVTTWVDSIDHVVWGEVDSLSPFVLGIPDTDPPAITVPSDKLVEATGPDGAPLSFTDEISAIDACDGPVTPTSAPPSGSTFPLGITTVTVSALDYAGNEASSTFRVTVRDTTPPSLTVPADMIVEASGRTGKTVSFTPTATDLVDGIVPPVSDPQSGSTFPLGTTTVTVTATDRSGNPVTDTFTVTVVDTTPPDIRMPADIVVEASGPGGRVVYFKVSANDRVDGAIAPSVSMPSGSLFPLGVTTVSVSATDDAGNVATAAFTITVRDTTLPTITCPSGLTAVTSDPDGAVVTFEVSAMDTVDGSITAAANPPSGHMFPVGDTVVTVTASDAAGNTATKRFTVSVLTALRDQKLSVIADLQTLLAPITNPTDRARLLGAITHVQNSASASSWLDQSHVIVGTLGERVFSEEKNAVADLKSLGGSNRSGLTLNQMEGYIDRLVAIDRALASVRIADAEATPGASATKIASARQALAAGDAQAAKNAWANAIDKYATAWKNACAAIAAAR